MTTASLPVSVTMPRARSQVRGFLLHWSAPTMTAKKSRPGDVKSAKGRSFQIRSNDGRTSVARTSPPVEYPDPGAQHEPVSAASVLGPGQRDSEVRDDLCGVSAGGALRGGEPVARQSR